MGYMYPPAAPTISGDVIQISRFLESPTLVARRLRTMLEQRFIADAILTGRYEVSGGAVLFETGESLYTADAPKQVAPGGEYPLTSVPSGPVSLAKTSKWGQDTEVTDESIKRQKFSPVEKGLLKLANQNVKTVDGVAMSAVATAVTQNTAAAASWTSASASQIFKDVTLAAAGIRALNEGYDPDTVVVSDLAWANAKAAFIDKGYLPRESENPAITGQFPVIDGLLWLVTPNLPVAGTAMVLDRKQLGGMADEKLGGPGYAEVGGVGVEVKTIRDDDNDQWRLRARRVTVPVVNEPRAAWKITGVGV